ncbi:ABC transporter substrate-binding protein [Streptomyces sp. NPDC005953]|uniref:ABC transporter substrate-binding protein n=1 Tax=Streptomyces sp. NPDC005953 TaxID=3156719 RepID=UPI0033C2C843
MTPWRPAPFSHLRRLRRPAVVPRPRRVPGGPAAVLIAAFAVLTTGCGIIPGTDDDSRATVTVMTFAPEGTDATNMPGMPAMATAYARWVNARGGIDGHTLRVITCNERNTRRGAADCADQAAEEGAVAVVGSYSQYGRSFLPPLQSAGIPFIGGYGISHEEMSSFHSYPVNGGQISLLAGHGIQLADVCGRVALVRPDSLAGDSLPALLDSGLARSGRETLSVLAPEDATDYTQYAHRARTHARATEGERPGCVTTVLGDRTETFFDSFRRLPGEQAGVRVSSVLGSVDQSLIDRTGGPSGIFEGAFLTGWYPPAGDARWADLRRVIDAHAFDDDRIDPADPGVQTTWIAYTVLTAVIEALDRNKITPDAISLALDRGLVVPTGGLTPPLRWLYEDTMNDRSFSRAVNRSVTFQVVRKGRLVAQRPDFVDVTTTLRAPRRT